MNGKVSNDEQLINLISWLDIKDIKKVKIEKIYHKIYYYFMFFLLGLFNKFIIVGDANSVLFKFLKLFYKKEKFILLDDGVATIGNKSINDNFKRFTIFPEHVKNHVENEFVNVKKLIDKSVGLEKKHIIVGAKFVDSGICDRGTYIAAIKEVIKHVKVDACLYIPHRGESNSELQAIKQTLSLNIIRLNLPIELISLEAKIYPLSISHTLSTAVFSMNKIYDAPIYTYQIPENKLIQRKAPIENLYKVIRSKNFSKFIN
ncbi:hypothetical protein [Pseudoalteromonas fuliginea]|uniref:hypothetical protein n=1 Tax=Pseudoalteromonas fuliginea TaxID=1872678 RepID=UPI0031811476